VRVSASASSATSPSTGGEEKSILQADTDLRLYRARKKCRDGDREVERERKQELYLEAKGLFQQVLRSSPKNGRAYVGLAKLHQRQKQTELARQVLEDGCAATKGENAHIWQVWACLESDAGDSKQARKLFDAAIAADKTLISAYHSWAMLEQREGNFEKSKQLLVKALAATESVSKPKSHVYVALARLAERTDELDAARAWYQLGIASGNIKDCGPALNSWAILEAKQGNKKLSRDLFKKALKGAKARFAWLSLGTWELRWGNLTQAREILKEANEMFPADAAIAQAYAQSYTKSSATVETDMKLARELYEKAVQVNERYQHTYQSWAMSEWLVGEDIDRARNLFQQGIWSGPSTKQAAKLFSSWAHMEAKEDQNMDLARSLYTCAYKIKPRSTKILLNWARDEETFGEIVRSEELRAMAREISSEFLPAAGEVGSGSQQQLQLERKQQLERSSSNSTLWPSNIASEISSEANGAAKVLAQFITEWNLYFDKAIREDKARHKMIVKQFQ